MKRWQLISVALLASSCADRDGKDTVHQERTPPLIAAAQSVSLEFPLHFAPDDSPPGFIKVASDGAEDKTGQHLLDALILCSPDIAWVEKTSESMSLVMPSDENAIWEEFKGWRPSDENIIKCIKDSVHQPFFYRKLRKGIQTYAQN